MFTLRDVSKIYSAHDHKVFALNKVSLSLPSTGFVVILGKSGSGKTTLLNMLGGLDFPSNGSVLFKGLDVAKLSQKELTKYRSNMISFVFQEFNLLKDLNCIENIRYALEPLGLTYEEQLACAAQALEKVELTGYEKRRINTLSGGQVQRIAIARALAKKSSVILCDEPTGNLDSATSSGIIGYLKMASKDRLVVIATHDEEIAELADVVIRISDGQIQDNTCKDETENGCHEKNRDKDETENGCHEKSRDKDETENGCPKESAEETKANLMKKTRRRPLLKWNNSVLRMVFGNIFSIKFTALFSCLLLTATFGLFNVFYSMSQYNKNRAFLNSLRASNSYLIVITKYVESAEPFEWQGETVYFGFQVAGEDVVKTDIDVLNDKYNGKANFCASYAINKSFSDFAPNIQLEDKITLETRSLLDDDAVNLFAFSFRNAVSFVDSNSFNTPLKYGSYLKEENDIIIYDYMADSLINFGVLDCKSTGEVVGKTLTDNDTGFSMRIAGIIGSNYKNLYDKNNLFNPLKKYSFSYLTGLQAIICSQGLIDKLSIDKDFISLTNAEFLINEHGEESEETEPTIIATVAYDKQKIVQVDMKADELENAVINEKIAKLDGIPNAIISRRHLSNILGEDTTLFTDEEILESMRKITLSANWMMYGRSITPSFTAEVTLEIMAVTNDDLPYVLVTNHGNSERNLLFTGNHNANFLSIYMNLSRDWIANESVLEDFMFPNHTIEFYKNNPTYYKEGWVSYNSFDILIEEADYYLEDVKETSQDILLYVAIGAILGLIMLAFNSIRANTYKIGVLKSLGFSNWRISIIFILQLAIIALIAFVSSIPLAVIVLSRVNYQFVKDLNTLLTFFSMTSGAIIMSAILALTSALLALVPLIFLLRSAPIKTIKSANS